MPHFFAEEEYHKLYRKANPIEIRNIVSLCKRLCLPPKTMASAIRNFYAARKFLSIEPDDLVLHSAVVSLACKMCETNRPLKRTIEYAAQICCIENIDEVMPKYIRCTEETEVDVAAAMDFDFEYPDFYGQLECLCRELNLESHYRKRAWIMLNDILLTPAGLFFQPLDIVHGCLLLEFVCSKVSTCLDGLDTIDRSMPILAQSPIVRQVTGMSGMSQDAIRLAFCTFLRINPNGYETPAFIMSELLKLYKGSR